MVCLRFTGDLSFVVGAVSMLMNECNDALIQNITYPPVILQLIVSLIAPRR